MDGPSSMESLIMLEVSLPDFNYILPLIDFIRWTSRNLLRCIGVRIQHDVGKTTGEADAQLSTT